MFWPKKQTRHQKIEYQISFLVKRILGRVYTIHSMDLPLSHKWVLWLHYPNDQNWGMTGQDHYNRVMEITDMKQVISLNKHMEDSLIQQCMVFIMKDGIQPIWEDPHNREGGRFSFKIPNQVVPDVWRKMTMHLLGGTLVEDPEFAQRINGLTISPKRAFCIVKLWMKDCTYTDVSPVVNIKGLGKNLCIFKKNLE